MRNTWTLTAGILMALLVFGISGCAVGAAPTQAPAPAASPAGSPSSLKVNLEGQQSIKTEAAGQVGISVTGNGQVTAVPDIAALRLGVVAQAKTVAEAQGEAATAMSAVMAALKLGGVADKDIQTSYFNITQLTRYDKDTERTVVIGYQVSNIVSAKIRDLPRTGSIIDAAAAAGGDLTRVNSIGFAIEDPTPYQTQAREKAMADAKAKATQMAGLAGVTVGRPVHISESSPGLPQPTRDYAVGAPAMAAPPTSISPGEMTITTTVSILYAIGD